jgi:hypothetical protein
MNIQNISTITALLVLVACSAEQSNELSVWDNYQSLAVKIDAQSGSASLKQLTYDATKLTDLSLQLLPDFVKKQPISLEYIQAAMAAKDEMLTLPLAEIEEYYHADGKLPAMQAAVCYHAKDLLIHPATAVVMSKTLADTPETREKIKQEILEVLEHFNQVKTDSGL